MGSPRTAKEWPPLTTTKESPHTATKTQHSQKSINQLKQNLRGFKLSPLSDLQVLHKQEVKVMIELYIIWLTVEGFLQHKEPICQN